MKDEDKLKKIFDEIDLKSKWMTASFDFENGKFKKFYISE